MARTKKKTIPAFEETEAVRNIRKMCKELHIKGWKTISMTYQGSGDSCDDFNFSIANEEDSFDFAAIPATGLPPDFKIENLRSRLWELLPMGFENNEGGDGELRVDIGTGAIHVKHNQYYIESDFQEWTYE